MKPLIASILISGAFLSTTACNNSTAVREKDMALQAQQHTIDSMNAELAKKKVIDSMNEVARIQYVIPQQMPADPAAQRVAPAAATTHTVRRSHTATHRSYASSGAAQSAPAVAQQAPVAETRKRGWSAKAKGAVIGAGAGAVAGAVINGRNRGAGAVIGGVSGAAVGTGIGAIIDRKHGR